MANKFSKKHSSYLLNLVKDRFPEHVIILLTGSYVSGKFNKRTSDIDMIIIDGLVNIPYTKKEKIKQYIFDFSIIPLVKIDKLIKDDIIFKRGTLSNMLLNARVVRDDHDLFSSILWYTKELLIKLYPAYSYNEIHKKCIRITNLIEDLKNNNNSFLENYYLVNEICELYLDLFLNQKKSFKGSGKHKFRNLENLDPTKSEKLSKCIKELIIENKKPNFIELVEGEVRKYNELTTSFSQRELDTNSRVDLILIFIPSKLIKYNELDKSIGFLNNSLKKKKGGILFFQNENEYLKFFIKNKDSKFNVCLDIIKYFGLRHKDLYKFEIHEVHELISPKFFEQVFESYIECAVSNIFLTRKEKIDLLIILFLKIIDYQKIGELERKIFFEYIEYIWLPAGYDLYLKLDYLSLKQYKQNLLSEIDCLSKGYNVELSSKLMKIATDIFAFFIKESTSNYNVDNQDYSIINLLYEEIGLETKTQIIFLEKYFSSIIQIFLTEKDKPFLAYICKNNGLINKKK